jgi:small subunit ribosomal protein S1
VAEALDELYEEEEERPHSIHDLQRKMRLEGTVTRIELFGAFVDIGVDVDGLVHISQLRTERVNRVAEVVQEGDQVTVWVLGVNPAKRRVDLTMIEPPAVDWDDLRAGQVYTGKVKRLERFGAFVDIGTTRDGLVHVSEITSDYIEDPKDYVKAGDEIQVKVLNVDRKRRRIELSMKALEEHFVDEDEMEETEESLTEMELAWREARKEQKAQERQARRKKERQQREDDDIFSRTLRLRGDNE